jgi:hypothetical protein
LSSNERENDKESKEPGYENEAITEEKRNAQVS